MGMIRAGGSLWMFRALAGLLRSGRERRLLMVMDCSTAVPKVPPLLSPSLEISILVDCSVADWPLVKPHY
jgi:hypothetical protein